MTAHGPSIQAAAIVSTRRLSVCLFLITTVKSPLWGQHTTTRVLSVTHATRTDTRIVYAGKHLMLMSHGFMFTLNNI